ncbi:MAG: UDP-N-acetylmuramoyl-L-alanine--D-glutamate ligase, partial [Lachnospiraceae bacterium]|nr:UDP-N-acetylmuramoyl-L-alanine--D-glutamate ligase [Lachnospiraceae bacterium]
EKLENSAYVKEGVIYVKKGKKIHKLCEVSALQIPGHHNLENALAAAAIGIFAGVQGRTVSKVLKTFKGVEHRLEFVREKGGVKFYNDSKATNPDASIKAINAMQGKTILIAGGKDNGTDYGEFVESLKDKVRYLILIGEAKKIIAYKARVINYNNIVYASTLDEAIEIANSYANIGDNILLSPACASTDMFSCYEERGERFKKKVLGLR